NDAEMDDAVNLYSGGSADALTTGKGVNSGRQALTLVSQQQAGLSDLNQNVARAFVRGWRVQLQEMRANYSVPQLLRFVDKDGDYKVKRWSASDLGSTRDVVIRKGSGTMMNPLMKAQLVSEVGAIIQLDPEDVKELVSSGLSPYTAFQDDRALLRVRGQIFRWEQGPPEEAQPPEPEVQIGPDGMPLMDPLGQPLMSPPPLHPALQAIFDPRPSDLAPLVATKRIRELTFAGQGQKYGQFPDWWKAGLDQELARMQQALQPPVPPPVPAPNPGAERQTSGGTPELTGAEQEVLGPSTAEPRGAT
ncbi:MAG: hypothetical protein L0191_00320, partial [Acidobacteria bacterium]|nr:hypothetical protein [Acidobacteriota bacterium]